MNLILLFEPERDASDSDLFTIDGERARHIRSVLASSVGDVIRVGLCDGPPGTAQLERLEGDSATLRVTFDDVSSRSSGEGLSLIVAVPRPAILKRLLPDVASLGVDQVVFLRSWRVHKPYLSTDLLTPAEYRPLLHRGMMQGRVTREPAVRIEPLFRPFVEDRVDAMFHGSRRFIADPGASVDIAALQVDPTQPCVIAIGPEGGWLPFERELFESRGFEPIHGGPRILRVETAAVALLSQMELLRRQADRSRIVD